MRPSPDLKIRAESTRGTLTVDHAAIVLKRFYFLLKELVKMQAGWLPGTHGLEEKLELAQSLWENALIAKALRERILELRYPERRILADEDREILNLWRSFANAEDGSRFLVGISLGLKPFLKELFSDYLELSDDLNDSPTVRILGHALEDFKVQACRASALLSVPQLRNDKWVTEVCANLHGQNKHEWLSQSSPSSVEFDWKKTGGKAFSIARKAARDPRFPKPLFAWPDRHTPARGAGEGLELQVRSAVHHLNEIWATEMAAAVIYDLLDEAPYEFLEDSARWCFDESRHCRMGYTRLREFGFNPTDIPVDTFSYDVGDQLDAVGRLGIIFYFETTYIHTKSERTKIFANYGDAVSSHDMDYDWADELIHTYYGNKWLKFFLEKEQNSRTPKQIKESAESAVRTIRSTATEKDYMETERYYNKILDKARKFARTGHSLCAAEDHRHE